MRGKYYTNARTAGTMPVWNRTIEKTAHNTIEHALTQAANPHEITTFASALNTSHETGSAPDKDTFQLSDILDIANPLHHIPLLNTAYRAVTGDAIKPAAELIGGTIFGGTLGFVSNLADMILETETGSDAKQHALNILKKPSPDMQGNQENPPDIASVQSESPALEHNDHDISLALLSFADLSHDELATELAKIEPGEPYAQTLSATARVRHDYNLNS